MIANAVSGLSDTSNRLGDIRRQIEDELPPAGSAAASSQAAPKQMDGQELPSATEDNPCRPLPPPDIRSQPSYGKLEAHLLEQHTKISHAQRKAVEEAQMYATAQEFLYNGDGVDTGI